MGSWVLRCQAQFPFFYALPGRVFGRCRAIFIGHSRGEDPRKKVRSCLLAKRKAKKPAVTKPAATKRAETPERLKRIKECAQLLADGYGYQRTAEMIAEKYGIGERMAKNDISEIYAEWAKQAEESIELARVKSVKISEANLSKLAEIRDERSVLVTEIPTKDGPIPVFKDHRIHAIREMTGVGKFLSTLQGTKKPEKSEVKAKIEIVDLTDNELDAKIKEKIKAVLKASQVDA